MKIYITDINVIFSAVLNINKIVKISGLEIKKVRRLIRLLYAQIIFISDELIPFEYYKNALPFVRDVDIDDLVFVALTDYLEETLWTGNLKLYNELLAKGYTRVVTFNEIKKELEN